MFVRTSTRRNKDGSPVRYLQLAHNEWDPARKASRTKVVYNFGRAEELDRAGIERLIGALSRLLGTQPPAAGDQVAGLPGLEFAESRPVGGAWLLDQLWRTPRRRHEHEAAAGRHTAAGVHRAGAVRAGGESGAGAELEAGRRLLGEP